MSGECTLATRQVTALATLFDCLRHVTGEVTLRVASDGIRIAQLEGNNSLYIYIHLLPDRFERYETTAPCFEATLLPATMHLVLTAILRKVRSDNSCLLQMRLPLPTTHGRPAHGAVHIDLTSASMTLDDAAEEEDDGAMMGYTLPCRYALVGADEVNDALFVPLQRNEGYDSVMYMSQRHLSHLVSHVFPLGEVVELSCDRKYATFAVTNQHALIGRAQVRFRLDCTGAGTNNGDVMAPAGDHHQHYFRQPLLSMLLRALSLYSTTAMMLPADANQPVLMEANLGDLGKMTVAIAQAATC